MASLNFPAAAPSGECRPAAPLHPTPVSGTGGGGGSGGGGGEATHRNRGDDTEPAAVTSPQSLDNGDVTTPGLNIPAHCATHSTALHHLSPNSLLSRSLSLSLSSTEKFRPSSFLAGTQRYESWCVRTEN